MKSFEHFCYNPISQQNYDSWISCITWITTPAILFSLLNLHDIPLSTNSKWRWRRMNRKSTGRSQGLGDCHSEGMLFLSGWHIIGTDPTFIDVSETICATDLVLVWRLARGPRLPSSAVPLWLSLKGNRQKKFQAIRFQILLILQRSWRELKFCFYEWKIGRKEYAMQTLFICKFTVCLNLWGCTSAGGNLESPPRLGGCVPAGDQLPPWAAFFLSTSWSVESTQPESRAWQGIKYSCIKW